MEGHSGEAIRVDRAGDPAGAGLHHTIRALIHEADLDRFVRGERDFFTAFMARLGRTLEDAFTRADPHALYDVHRSLYLLYEQNFSAPANPQAANQFHPFLIRIRNDIERAWERAEVARSALGPDDAPSDPERFAAFFKERCCGHRLARHPLFDYLALRANRGQIVEFFRHDRALILRFVDLVSLAMTGADDEVRGELATNLWDEMGNGNPGLRHTVLFRRLLAYAGCEAELDAASTERCVDLFDWQGFAGYNLHLLFSLNRRNYFRSVGCLGSSELMDGAQYAKILAGCRRVGMGDEEQLAYYASHVEIDAGHGETWLANVLLPLLGKYPSARHEIAIGAEMRLNVTADYFDSIVRKLVAAPRRVVLQPEPALTPPAGGDAG